MKIAPRRTLFALPACVLALAAAGSNGCQPQGSSPTIVASVDPEPATGSAESSAIPTAVPTDPPLTFPDSPLATPPVWRQVDRVGRPGLARFLFPAQDSQAQWNRLPPELDGQAADDLIMSSLMSEATETLAAYGLAAGPSQEILAANLPDVMRLDTTSVSTYYATASVAQERFGDSTASVRTGGRLLEDDALDTLTSQWPLGFQSDGVYYYGPNLGSYSGGRTGHQEPPSTFPYMAPPN